MGAVSSPSPVDSGYINVGKISPQKNDVVEKLRKSNVKISVAEVKTEKPQDLVKLHREWIPIATGDKQTHGLQAKVSDLVKKKIVAKEDINKILKEASLKTDSTAQRQHIENQLYAFVVGEKTKSEQSDILNDNPLLSKPD